MSAISTTYNKSNTLELVAKNETIDYNTIYMFLDDCYSSNDIESVKLLTASSHMAKQFACENTYNAYRYEITNIMKKLTRFNNIDIIDIIMRHINDSNKRLDPASYIVAYLYKYNFKFNTIADELINKYNVDYGMIIINMYANGSDIDKIKYMISLYPSSIQSLSMRKWMLSYCASNNDINMINFLELYYLFTDYDIFNILFNFSKSTSGSKELYNYIFNNYFDTIKNETDDFCKLIEKLFNEEYYDLIYFIVNKITFNDDELINIFECVFSYEHFFSEIIENITNIMLNTYNMQPSKLKELYSLVENKNVNTYIQNNMC